MLKPSLAQILPRLFWPALFVCLGFGFAAWAYPLFFSDRINLHWMRNAAVLKAVHCLTLGQLGLLFLAVLVQAVPVLFHRPQASVRVSLAGQILWGLGVLGLISYFAGWRTLLVLVVTLSALMAGATILWLQARAIVAAGTGRTIAWQGLGPAFLYLGFMLVLGAAMAWGLIKPGLPQDPLQTLQLHIHVGLWGFAGLAIFGFLPKLLRLFQSSTGYATWPQRTSFVAVHGGLGLLFVRWLGYLPREFETLAGLALLLAALLFAFQISLLLFRARARRLDSSLALQLSGVVFLLVAASLDAWLLAGHGTWRQEAATVVLGLGGFISLTLLGTLQRICAVLGWFQRFYEAAKTHAVPTAWELIHPKLAWSILPLQSGAASLLAGGLWTGNVSERKSNCLAIQGGRRLMPGSDW